MTVKSLVAGMAGMAGIAAVAGVAGVLGGTDVGAAPVSVQPVVFDVPLDPPPASADLPSAEQLTGILDNLADPGVNYRDKNMLVQGGIPDAEGHQLDHRLRQAYRHGDLPLTFTVTNIAPAGANQVGADVTVSGPKLPAPVTKPATFVNQGGGWMLAQDSAMALIEDFAPR